jgi:hypothetical protein
MKKFIGLLVLVSMVIVAGTAYAAQLNIGSRYYTKWLDRNSFNMGNYATTGNGVIFPRKNGHSIMPPWRTFAHSSMGTSN